MPLALEDTVEPLGVFTPLRQVENQTRTTALSLRCRHRDAARGVARAALMRRRSRALGRASRLLRDPAAAVPEFKEPKNHEPRDATMPVHVVATPRTWSKQQKMAGRAVDSLSSATWDRILKPTASSSLALGDAPPRGRKAGALQQNQWGV